MRTDGHFGNLHSTTQFPWNIELIECFLDKWDWECLSKNHSLPWSLGLIVLFFDKWDFSELSKNPSVPWNLELLEYAASQEWELDWKSINALAFFQSISVETTVKICDLQS